MVQTILVIVALFGASTGLAHEGMAITSAKIAELAAHRADRLVALGKIDPGFVNRLERIQVLRSTTLPEGYDVLISQTQPAENMAPLRVELTFSKEGKSVSHRVIEGGVVGPDHDYSPSTAGELVEIAMHHLIDSAKSPGFDPFVRNLTDLKVSKSKLRTQDVALVKVLSGDTADKLHIYLGLDGTIQATDIQP